MSKVFMFPGQGSQKKGMGEELFKKHPQIVNRANEVLGYDLVDVCLNQEDKLNHTLYTQPALFTVNALYFEEVKSESVEYYIGHSLGEYNALLAAQAFDFETGLKLVQKRAELMSEAKGGAMAAVIGMEVDELNQILKDHGDTIDVANYNSPGQLVISGKRPEIMAAIDMLEEKGAKRVIELPVSGAFHSRYLKAAGNDFRDYLDNFKLAEPQIPVIANVDAKAYTLDSFKDRLASQIYSSVQWIDTINLLHSPEREFIEIGPGNVLTGLYKRIIR